MNENSTNTALLVQYLDGELSGDRLDAFNAQIENNAAMQQELQNLREARLAVQLYGTQQKVTALHKEMMEELHAQPVSRTSRIRRMWKPLVSIAAVLVVGFCVAILYQYVQLSSTSLFKEQYHSFVLHEDRGVPNTSQLEVLYNAKAYDQVLALFGQMQQPPASTCFLSGNAALQVNKSAIAINCFLLAQQQNTLNQTHFFEDAVDYYLAMAYLQNDQPQKALPLFEKIHADSSHPYNRQVSGWFLKKLHWVVQKK